MCIQYSILGSDYPPSPGKVVDGDVIARHKYSLDCLVVFLSFLPCSFLAFYGDCFFLPVGSSCFELELELGTLVEANRPQLI
jgi:hypothetical protein